MKRDKELIKLSSEEYTQLNIRVSKSFKNELKIKSIKKDISLNQLVLEYLEEGLKAEE